MYGFGLGKMSLYHQQNGICGMSAPQESATLTHDAIVHKYADVFQGFGALPFTYSIKLREDAQEFQCLSVID